MAQSTKPFLNNKGNLENPEIMPQDGGNNTSDESVLITTSKENCRNIAEKSCSKKLNSTNENSNISNAEVIRLMLRLSETIKVQRIKRNLLQPAQTIENKINKLDFSESMEKPIK